MRIALLASRRLRHGPMSPLLRFARDYMPFLQRHDIVTTEGCYKAFLRAGLFKSHGRFFCIGSGYEGALVRITSSVVEETGDDSLNVVIYLVEPRDPTSNFPETNALKRECVVHEKPFLATSRSARAWAALTWRSENTDDLERYFIDPELSPIGGQFCFPLQHQTSALIAHDAKKSDILKFSNDYFDFILAFGRRVGTGTTGTLLNGDCPTKYKDNPAKYKKDWENVQSLCAALKEKIIAARAEGKLSDESRFVEPQNSGPEGGDVQIARLVLDGKCQTIVFFEDPDIARQHEQDIQLLERTGRTRGKKVICIHDSATAADIATKWLPVCQSKNGEPMHVATALERRFNVKAILIDGSRQPWERILDAAASYFLSHVAALSEDRKRVGDVVRVTVSWGVGMSQLAQRIAGNYEDLKLREQFEADRRQRVLGLADERYFRPGKVIETAPMQGVMAAADDAVEGNTIAKEIADFFNGKSHELALAALMAKSSIGKRRSVPTEISEHWDRTDILITTCVPVRRESAGRVRAPEFDDYTRDMKNLACGDFGGIYLTREGVTPPSDEFERIGMDLAQVKSIRYRGGHSVLVVGAEDHREEIAATILKAGLMNIIITDLDFARRLLMYDKVIAC